MKLLDNHTLQTITELHTIPPNWTGTIVNKHIMHCNVYNSSILIYRSVLGLKYKSSSCLTGRQAGSGRDRHCFTFLTDRFLVELN